MQGEKLGMDPNGPSVALNVQARIQLCFLLRDMHNPAIIRPLNMAESIS